MNINKIPDTFKSIIKDTAEKLSGYERRIYIARITIELLDASTRKAERVFGWGRKTVETGMMELITGIRCVNNYSAQYATRRPKKRCPILRVTYDQ